jgi:hypothetical protein
VIPALRAALVLLLDRADGRSHGPDETAAWDEVRRALGLTRGCQDHDGHRAECPHCPISRTATCPHGHHGGL